MSSATLPDDRTVAVPDDGRIDDASASLRTARGVGGWVRANRLFASALAVAAALRLVVAIAYPPALEFFGDSGGYLAASRQPFNVDLWHPFGYPVLVWIVSVTRSLAALTTLQHLLGLLTGWLVYRLVRRLGVGPVGATVAAAPVLFDAYQLALEHYVLSETLFTFLVVACLTLTARLVRAPTTAAALGLGALLGLSVLTRTVGLAVAAALVVSLAVARIGWSRVAAVATACAIPVGCYVLAFHATYGVYAVQGYGGRFLYGIVAPFASCDRHRLPEEQRLLCPTLPSYARPGSNQYVWNEFSAAHLPGTPIQRSEIAGQFARRVVTHQPGQLAAATVGTLLHYFEPGREIGPRDWFVGSWQFPLRDRAPAWNLKPATLGYHPEDRVHGRVVVGPAQVLRAYQRVVFVPGPALLLALVSAALALCLRRGDVITRRVMLALALTGIALLAMPSVSAGFDWRYLLPAQAVLVPAGVLAATSLRARWRLSRRVTAVGAAALTVALIAPGLPASSVYAASTLTPPLTGTVPGTQSVGGHADVHVGRGVLLGVHCFANTEGRKRLFGLAAFPATIHYRSGPPLLAQMENFGLSNGELALPGIRPAGEIVRSAVLSDRYPGTGGVVYAYVSSESGVLRYVDPLGGGAAAWSFHLPSPPPPQPRLGAGCTGTAPWAGMQLSYLKIRPLPTFTTLPDQTVDYGLTWQPWRAESYDVRFRVASPTTGLGPWQYPRHWQRTSLTEQSLVNLSPGLTYCFSIRARDSLGAVTGWRLPRCTSRLYDDAALPAGPEWTRATGRPGFYFGSYSATRMQGATISMAGTFSRVELSAYHCPDCGVLDVYIGSRLLKSLDLSSSAADAGLVTWTSRLLAEWPRTLTLRVRSKDRLVALDAFGLLR